MLMRRASSTLFGLLIDLLVSRPLSPARAMRPTARHASGTVPLPAPALVDADAPLGRGVLGRVDEDAGEFSLASFNILAPSYLGGSKSNTAYDYIAAEHRAWPRRRALLLGELERLDADVLLLQEVDQRVFEELVAALPEYDGERQRRDARYAGCATFWRRATFGRAADRERPDPRGKADLGCAVVSRSRALIVALASPGETDARVAIANVHLQGGRESEAARVAQIESALAVAAATQAGRVVVGGDFNSAADEAPARSLLDGGDFCSVYDEASALAAAPARGGAAAAGGAPTFVVPGCATRIDHLIYSTPSLALRAVRRTLSADESVAGAARRRLLRRGLPDHRRPSDHLPIGAVFALGPRRAPGDDAAAAATTGAATTPAPAREAERGLGDAGRALLHALLWTSPAPTARGARPSEAQIARIRGFRAAQRDFIAPLGSPEQRWAKRYSRQWLAGRSRWLATTESARPSALSALRRLASDGGGPLTSAGFAAAPTPRLRPYRSA